MPWKSFLRNYFRFSRNERYGIAVLCSAIFLVSAVKISLPYIVKPKTPDLTAYKEEIASFFEAVDASKIKEAEKETGSAFSETESELFYFDPNNVSDEEWKKLGLNDRQISNIRNYLAKGGRFRKKEDLRKIYSLPVTQYKLLEPYIVIKTEETPGKTQPKSEPDSKTPAIVTRPDVAGKEIIILEINTADSSRFTRLSGIGPVLASRIIRYRNLIGGFANPAQLSEVYGVSVELVENLENQLSADSALIKKIPINTAKFGDMVRHPYISEHQTRGILQYIKLQGNIKDINELVRNNIFTAEEAEKIKPYLDFRIP